MRRRGLTITLLLLVPAATFIGVGTLWSLEAERTTLADQALSEARSTLAHAARVVTDDVDAHMRRRLADGRAILQGRRTPVHDPTDDRAPLLIVRDPNGRRIQPPPASDLVLLDEALAGMPQKAQDDLRVAMALQLKGGATAARGLIVGLAQSPDPGVANQARFRIADAAGDLGALRELASSGRGLSSAQRFAAARALVADAASRRDADRLRRDLLTAWTWLRQLVLGGVPTATWWVDDLCQLAEGVDADLAADVRERAAGRARETTRLRAIPGRLEVSGGTETWVATGARRALATVVRSANGTRLGQVAVLPPAHVELEAAVVVLESAAVSDWTVTLVSRDTVEPDAVAAPLKGAVPDLVVLGTRDDASAPFPWRTAVGALFLVACLGVMGLGVVLSLRSARQRERMVEARTEFLATVAHQLKTPVANLRLFAETLASGDVADEADRERMQGILESEAGRLSEHVERVLSVVRLDETTAAASSDRIDLGEVLADLRERWLRQATAHDVTLKTRIDADIPTVQGDERALADAVQNVVDNAIRFTREGGDVSVDVSSDNGTVRIRVSDDGPGIADAHRDRVFERFFRGDDAKKRAGEGTGLGLAIARDGVRRCGGEVVIESTGEKGTTMTLELPVARRADA